MKKVLLFALALYLLIAPLTYHPDNKLVLRWAALGEGKVWNIYSFHDQHPEAGPKFNYPPVHFVLAKLQYSVASVIAGDGFVEWLNTDNTLDAFESNISTYMLAVKIVIIFTALASAQLIYMLVLAGMKDKHKAVMAAALWLFNPITLYSVVVMGQNDVFSIFFFLLGWYLLQGKRWYVSTILFALAIGTKFYPILWVTFLLSASANHTVKQRLLVFLGTILSSALLLLPFLSSLSFRTAVLQSSINDRFLIPQVTLDYTESIYLIPILLVFVASIAVFFAKNASNASILNRQAAALFVGNSILLGFSHFHPQWFVWLVPFWSIYFVSTNRDDIKHFVALASGIVVVLWTTIIILFRDSFLSWGLLVPFRGDSLFLPRLYDILLAQQIDALKIVNMAHSVLAGLALVSILLLVTKNASQSQSKILTKSSANLFGFRSNVLALTIGIFAPVLIVGIITMVMYSLPIPTVSQSSFKESFVRIKPITIVPFRTPSEGTLKRIYIPFQNIALRSTSDLSFIITDKSGSVLQKIVFSGKNIGETTLVRFDIVPLLEKDTEYVLHIQATGEGTEDIYIAMNSSQEDVWQRYFIDKPITASSVVHETTSMMSRLIRSLWWLFICISALLYYTLFNRNRK